MVARGGGTDKASSPGGGDHQRRVHACGWAPSNVRLGLGDVEVVYQVVTKTKKPVVDVHRVDRREADIGELHRVVDGVLAGAYWPSRG